MKKWFTLIESLIVLVIISIVTSLMFNMRYLWADNRNIWKEVVNTVYKEMQLLLKDLNRNRIYISWDNKYEIAYFQIKFNPESKNSLSINNIYISTDTENSGFLQHIETTELIKDWKYKARNAIKWANDLFFKIINSWYNDDNALISKNWIIETGDIVKELKENSWNYKIPTDIEENEQECQTILYECEENLRSELIVTCLTATNFYRKNCSNILDFNTTKYATTQWITNNYSFVVCGWEKSNQIDQPIWKLTVNIATKNVSLEWCNNNRVNNWIDCWTNICTGDNE